MPLYSHKRSRPQVDPTVFIAPSAQVIGNVVIGKLSSIWFQTVLRADFDAIRIGEETNIQDMTTCHADEGIPLSIGSRVTVGHRCVVHGCTIEDDCLIGMGSIVMNRAVIGEGSVVAAGTVILENTIIPPYSLVTGAPGKIKKTYKDKDEIKNKILEMSGIYTANAADFNSEDIFFKIEK